MRSATLAVCFLGAVSPILSAIITSREVPSGNMESLIARQDGEPQDCDRTPGNICTASHPLASKHYVSMSGQMTQYGTRFPREAVDMLWEGCIDGGCNVKEMTIDSQYGSSTGVGSATIEVMPHGNWPPNLRHDFIWAMTELVGTSITEREVCEQGGSHNAGFCYRFFVAPQDFHINRYRVGDDAQLIPEGFISVSMYQADGDSNCEQVMSALSTFGGLIPEDGGIFGFLSFACS